MTVDIIVVLFEELKVDYMKLIADSNASIEIKESVITFICNDFILMYDCDACHFYLSFRVGAYGKTIGICTKLIASYIHSVEYTIIDDSFFDVKSKKLVFGSDAIECSNKHTLQSNGKFKCDMCDGVYTIKNMSEHENICVVCSKHSKNMVWH